jgi:hypothetical protein
MRSQLSGIFGSELTAPQTDCLIADDYASRGKPFFDVSEGPSETMIQPNGTSSDFGRKPMPLVQGGHRSNLERTPCLAASLLNTFGTVMKGPSFSETLHPAMETLRKPASCLNVVERGERVVYKKLNSTGKLIHRTTVKFLCAPPQRASGEACFRLTFDYMEVGFPL